MKIWDNIVSALSNRRRTHVLREGDISGYELNVTRYPFGRTVYMLIVNTLISLFNEVNWVGSDTEFFKAWRSFVDSEGLRILGRLFHSNEGYVVIAWRRVEGLSGELGWLFWLMQPSEYQTRQTKEGDTIVEVRDKSVSFYVMRSPQMEIIGISEHQLAVPYIKYIDNVFNGSNTIVERLGTFVVMSPSADEHTAAILSPQEKQELEEEMQRNYGALSRQKQIMLLPRGMNSQIVNLAGIDQKTSERVLLAVKVLADLIGVPANQIALIDASSSKSLSNGTEIREGDLLKYRNFRRLLNATFYKFAVEIGLRVDYSIENEPLTTQGQTIERI